VWNININILEVVDSRPANDNGFRGHQLKIPGHSPVSISSGFHVAGHTDCPERGRESFYYKSGETSPAVGLVPTTRFRKEVISYLLTGLMHLSLTKTLFRNSSRLVSASHTLALLLLFQFSELTGFYEEKKASVYNVLWVLVFGFATLNILGLVLRRFEPRRSGLNFGEILAITVVLFSLLLLALEMLNLFHIFPIRLEPH